MRARPGLTVLLIALLATPSGRPAASADGPHQNLEDKWHIDAQPTPVPAKVPGLESFGEAGEAMHGNFTARKTFRVLSREKLKILFVYDEEANFQRFVWDGEKQHWESSNEVVEFEPGLRRSPTLVLTDWTATTDKQKQAWTCDEMRSDGFACPVSIGDPNSDLQHPTQYIRPLEKDRFEWVGPNGARLTMRRVVQTPAMDDKEFKGWSDVFNTKETFIGSDFPFIGFDISKVEPWSIQSGPRTQVYMIKDRHGGSLQISGMPLFDFPHPSSRRYFPYQSLYYPIGVSAYEFDSAQGATHSLTVGSEKESYRAWSASIGANVGVPGFSVGIQSDYRTETQSQLRQSRRSVISQFLHRKAAMVLEMADVSPHEEFVGALHRLADPNPNWNDFFAIFGTHYAHAVTFGGRYVMQQTFSEQAEFRSRKDKVDIKANASGVFEGLLSVGGSVGEGFEWGGKLGKSVSQEDTYFKTAGGVADARGGYSVSRGTEVPISLDLRPLYQLINPILFPTRPDFWFSLRPQLREQTLARMADVPFDARSNVSRIFELHAADAPDGVDFWAFSYSWTRPDLTILEEDEEDGRVVVAIPREAYCDDADALVARADWARNEARDAKEVALRWKDFHGDKQRCHGKPAVICGKELSPFEEPLPPPEASCGSGG